MININVLNDKSNISEMHKEVLNKKLILMQLLSVEKYFQSFQL